MSLLRYSSTFKRTLCDNLKNKDTLNFDQLASKWWDVKGPFCALHSMNMLRIPWILNTVASGQRCINDRPLKGIKILDVGCGGGILSIPLAKLGAHVTGIDLSDESISVCQHIVSTQHPQLKIRENINFKCCSVEELAFAGENKFDVVIASEVVEHVDEIHFFMKGCADLTADHGHIFITTINRNLFSFIFAKYVAEYILRVVPPGMHDYSKFVTLAELQSLLLKNGFQPDSIKGMFYNFSSNSWSWVPFTTINYAVHAKKPI